MQSVLLSKGELRNQKFLLFLEKRNMFLPLDYKTNNHSTLDLSEDLLL